MRWTFFYAVGYIGRSPIKVGTRCKRRQIPFQIIKNYVDPSSTTRVKLILVRRQQKKLDRFWIRDLVPAFGQNDCLPPLEDWAVPRPRAKKNVGSVDTL